MSSTDTLRAHLKRLKAEVEATPDAARLRDEWVADLRRLIDTLHGWLRDAENEGLLRIVESTTKVEEARYGTYDAPTMTVTAPDGRTLAVHPIGLDVSGHQGRVDLERGPQRARLLRSADRGWKLSRVTNWSQSPPDPAVLDEQSFADVVDALLGLSDSFIG